MSVFIKGMEMPENCLECAIASWSPSGYDYVCPFSGIMTLNIGRQNDCPLVEVPTPHGRLIDADELKNEYPHDVDWEYPVNTNGYVSESIDNAQTVIEAEGEDT